MIVKLKPDLEYISRCVIKIGVFDFLIKTIFEIKIGERFLIKSQVYSIDGIFKIKWVHFQKIKAQLFS